MATEENGNYSATAVPHGVARGSFHEFFETWLTELDAFLEQLVAASSSSDPNLLRPLLDRTVSHYDCYYAAKSSWANSHILSVMSPAWISDLESAFLWVGGFRPSTAFQLLYSKLGIQLEPRLLDICRGVRTGDLADISPPQLVRLDQLQARIILQEREMTEKMAKHQEGVADASMVGLSHDASVATYQEEEGGAAVESALGRKREGFERMLERADGLRLETLHGVLEVLTPSQAVHFLIAAAELHLRVHDWGRIAEPDHNLQGSNTNHPASPTETTD